MKRLKEKYGEHKEEKKKKDPPTLKNIEEASKIKKAKEE